MAIASLSGRILFFQKKLLFCVLVPIMDVMSLRVQWRSALTNSGVLGFYSHCGVNCAGESTDIQASLKDETKGKET